MSNWRALLIGVPEYTSDAITPLTFIQNDILRLEKAFESSEYSVRSVGLKENLTGGLIRQHIHKFCVKEAKAGETIIICFSGHGLHYNGSDYLVPSDAYIEDIDNIALYLVPVDFVDIFEKSPAEAIIFFIDACREGIELGSKSVLNIVNWGKGKLSAAKKRDIAYIFACEPGEVSRYVAGPDGFSLFSRALAEVIHSECKAVTFEDVLKELQNILDQLADDSDKPRQKVRVHLEVSAGDNRLQKRPICKKVANDEIRPITEDAWYHSAVLNEMWTAESIATHASTEDLKYHVGQLVTACRLQWQKAKEALSQNAWQDEGYPTRIVELTTYMVSKCESSLDLSPAEVALLSIAPYVYEAVLATAIEHATNANPFSLEGTGTTTGFRSSLEKIHLSMPQLIRKAKDLKENGQIAEHNAIAIWLLYRSIFRDPYSWMDRSQGGYISGYLLEALLQPSRSQSRVTRDSLTRNRLLEIARCINANPERIERIDRPGALMPEVYIAPSITQYEQAIREKLLAYLLNLASWMAIDSRMLHEVIIDHIGLSDPVVPEEVLHTVSNTQWIPDAGGRSLKVVCRHPAIDLALQEHVQQLNIVLDVILKRAHTKQDGMDVLNGLPQRLTAHEISPMLDENGVPFYETPHLRFQLAHDKIRELLMGEQLYGDPTLAVRELYQNALDACRYRLARMIYLKYIGKYAGSKWEGHIIFRQSIENGRPFIECEDNGIGMGRRELTDAFSCAGKRFSDMPEFIEEQAEWLRCDPPIRLYPNSQFGIGVFSYFMLADEIEVETCRLDRTGKLGQRLIVQISGSGSLFRIRSLDPNGDAGTRVRLYLNKTQNTGKWGLSRPISCLNIMNDQLKVAEFPTEVIEGDQSDTWLPGKYHMQSSDDNSILAPDQPGLWWIKDENSSNSSNTYYWETRSWTGNGRFLSDGIITGTYIICAIIDLKQAQRPKLTIDRKEILEWDKIYVKNLIRDRVSVLLENPNWLSYEWLLNLELLDPKAVEFVVNNLTARDNSILLRLKTNQDILVPLSDIGFFGPDRIILSASKRGSWHTLNRSKIIQDIKKNIPPFILMDRVQKFIKYGLRFPHQFNDLFEGLLEEYGAYNDSEFKIPKLHAGDSVALSQNLNGRGPWVSDHAHGINILVCAYRLDESFKESLQRFERLSPLGFSVPSIDPSKFTDISINNDDIILFSQGLDGNAPWLGDEVGCIHILRAAIKLNKPIGSILRRLQQFAPFGIAMPDLNPDQFDDFRVTKEDLALIPIYLNENDSQLNVMISCIHVLRAAGELNETVGTILRRLSRFAPFGITAPDLNPDQFDNFSVTKEDLALIPRGINEKDQQLKAIVSCSKILRAAGELNEPVGATLRRIPRFAPFGITAPDLNPEQFDEFRVAKDDLPLIPKDSSGEDSLQRIVISGVRILWAAGELNETVGTILRRLQRFAPFGIIAPDLNPDQFDDFRVTKNDLALIPRGINEKDQPLKVIISGIHILRAAGELDESVGAILRRLSRFAPFGITVPDLNSEQFEDFKITYGDLLFLRHLYRFNYMMSTNAISEMHIRNIANYLDISVEEVQDKIKKFKPFGLAIGD